MTKMKTKLLAAAAIVIGAAQIAAAQDRVTWWYEQATPDQQKLIKENIVEPFDKANPEQHWSRFALVA